MTYAATSAILNLLRRRTAILSRCRLDLPALVLSVWRAYGCLPELVTADAGASSDR